MDSKLIKGGSVFCTVISCVLSPDVIGLDWRNQELSRSLTTRLRIMLCTVRDNLKTSEQRDMYNQLSGQVLYDCASCLERLGQMCQGLLQVELKDKQYVDGLSTLKKTDLLGFVQHGHSWDGNTILRGVFSSVFDSDGVPLHPETSVLSFADQLISFAVLSDTKVNATLDCVLDNVAIKDPRTGGMTTRGQHFLSLFQDQLIAHLLQDPAKTVSRLVDKPSADKLQILLQMFNSCRFNKVKFNRSAESLVSSVTKAWPSLEIWATPQQTHLLELVQALVQVLDPTTLVGSLNHPPCHPSTSSWLFRQIRDPAIRLEYKADLVDLLPSVVDRETNAQLEQVLRHLQPQFPVSSSELKSGSVERNTFIVVYKAVLRTLVATSSITVLKFISESAADSNHACGDAINAALREFMRKCKQETQIQALEEIHDKFLDESKDIEMRLGLISRFLIPLICEASKPAVTQFYADRIQSVIDMVEEKLKMHDQEWRVHPLMF